MLYPTDYGSETKHKSNLFQVNVMNTQITETEENLRQMAENGNTDAEKAIDKLDVLKFNIRNAVGEIAKNIAPANT